MCFPVCKTSKRDRLNCTNPGDVPGVLVTCWGPPSLHGPCVMHSPLPDLPSKLAYSYHLLADVEIWRFYIHSTMYTHAYSNLCSWHYMNCENDKYQTLNIKKRYRTVQAMKIRMRTEHSSTWNELSTEYSVHFFFVLNGHRPQGRRICKRCLESEGTSTKKVEKWLGYTSFPSCGLPMVMQFHRRACGSTWGCELTST